MVEQLCDGVNIGPLHPKPGRRGAPQIVETEILDTRRFAAPLNAIGTCRRSRSPSPVRRRHSNRYWRIYARSFLTAATRAGTSMPPSYSRCSDIGPA